MNTNELKAYNWLQKKRYSNIVFHPHSTPDFTTNEGGFEVKTLDSNAISFTPTQFKQLSEYPDVHILVFNEKTLPTANIPFSEISGGKPKWDNINIKQVAPRLQPMKNIVVTIPTFNRFLSYRQYGESHEGILIKLMDMADKYKAMTNHHKNSRGKNDTIL